MECHFVFGCDVTMRIRHSIYVVIVHCLSLLGCVPAQTHTLLPQGEVLPWADSFMATHVVVDANLNYFVRIDPSCKNQCERSVFPGTGPADFSGIKPLTGVDVGFLSISHGLISLEGQRNIIEDRRGTKGRIIRRYSDISAAQEAGQYGVMFYVQRRAAPHWQLRGDVKVLGTWYAAGLRVFQLAYGSTEQHGSDEKLGFGSDEGDTRGLTDLGVLAVHELNQLGMVIDVSHCNERTTLDAAALSAMPIVATHSNAEALNPHPRNKSDAEIQAIAASGGVIGITPINWMVDANRDNVGDMSDVVAQLTYVRNLVGVEHVGVATDGYIDGWDSSSRHAPAGELNTAVRWKTLAIRLHEVGWPDDDIAKVLGGNWLRVFKAILEP